MRSPTTSDTSFFAPVSFTRVSIDDVFWAPRLRANREMTLPIQFQQCKETGRIDALKLDWQPGKGPEPHIFWDSDVAKWMEAAAYSLATHPDPELAKQLEAVIELLVASQQPDGYINSHYSTVEPDKRWSNLRDCHELYCAGHLIEAAVAHFHTTGQRHFLDAMCRYADYIDSVFGPEPEKKHGYCGHEEIELALLKLYRATDNARYLRLSQYFVNERGCRPYYFDAEAEERGENPQTSYMGRYEYCQAHVPVREQREVVGHSVRAMYLYSAMAELAGETGDTSLLEACKALWNDLVLHKLYLTGGIGSTHVHEGFTDKFDLPNETAYAETCAAIGLVFWSHRMLQLEGDRRYADVMERALYNGVLSGVSMDGAKFFYDNPLASRGEKHRQEWFGCACCPPNLARLLASLGEYVYSTSADGAAIHLYIQGDARLVLASGSALRLRQQTRYPWEGHVRITVEPEQEAEFTLRLRYPGWCNMASFRINGAEPEWAPLDKGYACLRRTWKPGDTVDVAFAMPVERIVANPRVVHDGGRIALQRGPLVYCLEDADQTVPVGLIMAPEGKLLRIRFENELLNGVVVLEGKTSAVADSQWADSLYLPLSGGVTVNPTVIRAIPYFAWDNRKPGAMAVWLPRF